MRRKTFPFLLALAALWLGAAAPARADGEARPARADGEARPPRADAEARPPSRRACLSAAETRDEIKTRHLREPFTVLKHAAQSFKAEALSAKLCRIDDEFVYEITLLHRDGKFFHAHINATTGKIVEYKRAAASPDKK